MYAPLPSTAKAGRILFLSRGEARVRMDVKAFRAMGVKDVTHLADTGSAINYLRRAGNGRRTLESTARKSLESAAVDLVVCDESLKDGSASIFLYALAKEEGMNSQPVLVLTSSVASAGAMRGAGLYALERPYSLSDLERMVQKAMSPMRRPLRKEQLEKAAAKRKLPLAPHSREEAAKKRVEKAAAARQRPLTVSDWYSKGVEHLKRTELVEAESAFLQVLGRQEDHIDAALGLARVHRAGGDGQKTQRYMLKAAASCLRQGDAERAGGIAEYLPDHLRNDIYAAEAVACLEEGFKRQAVVSFLDAAREGAGKPLHRIVARACSLTARPEECMEQTCAAFESFGNTAIAASLRRRLLEYAPVSEYEPSTWLDRFPRLKEVVSIAGFTARVWKRA